MSKKISKFSTNKIPISHHLDNSQFSPKHLDDIIIVEDILAIFKIKKNRICKVTKKIPTSKKVFEKKVLQFKKAHTMHLNSEVHKLTKSIQKENKVSMLLS